MAIKVISNLKDSSSFANQEAPACIAIKESNLSRSLEVATSYLVGFIC